MMLRAPLAATVMLLGMAAGTQALAADKAAFVAAYQAADEARKAAAAVGFEWRDTADLLRQAYALGAKGEYAAAIVVAEQARFEGEQGQRQAAEQAALWQSFVVTMPGKEKAAGPSQPATREGFAAAYKAADEARKAAAAVGYEWRDTLDLLREAYALAEKGDFAAAVKRADDARFEGEQAQRQAAEQEKNWRSFVLR